MRKTVMVLGLLLAFSVGARSAPELVRDFRAPESPVSSYPENLFSNGERAFFFADDGHGHELWTSDGTAAGTRLVADLDPGPKPDFVDVEPGFVASGDLVYFWHRDIDVGFATNLWRTDGTPNGTFRILTDSWYSGLVVPFGERGAIIVADGLYVTDGETVHELEVDFTADALVNVNGVAYAMMGDWLWRTDGTASGTRAVFEFDGYVDRDQLVAHDGALYVLLEPAPGTAEVWRSDGTAEGTKRLASFTSVAEWPRLLGIESGVFVLLNNGASTRAMRVDANGATPAFTVPGVFGGAAVASRDFFAFETDDPLRLWRSDGTTGGTRAITGGEVFYDFTVTRSHVIYVSQLEVWAHDGTAAHLLAPNTPPNRLEIAEVGERFLLPLYDEQHGAELWVSNGRTSGTALLKNIRAEGNSEGSLARRLGDSILFRAYSDEHGLEPWVVDSEGLRVIDVDIGPASSDPRLFTDVNGRLLFLSNPEPNHPSQIRVTDGDGLHTIMSYDFRAWWDDDEAAFPVVGDRAFLFGHGVDGNEVWTTDATLENTRRGASLPYIDQDFDPVAANGVVFFVSDYDALWRTDGTFEGTYALASDVHQMQATPSRLFFVSHGSAFGLELWVSDGTLAGTHVVKDIQPGPAGAFSEYEEIVFQTLGDTVVFAADDGVHGTEPWRSDGTEAGTYLLRDVAPGEAPSMLPRFDLEVSASAGGFAYFVADDGVHGRELWRTDGSAGGTVLVRDIARGRASSTPARMRAIGDRVYFAADDGVHGRELWWSSLAGTGLVANVAPGADSSFPHDMTELDGWIYFFATTEATGDELWRVEVPKVRRRAARQ